MYTENNNAAYSIEIPPYILYIKKKSHYILTKENPHDIIGKNIHEKKQRYTRKIADENTGR